MARPRSETVIPNEPGFYLCTSRCVRRAMLCGDDPLTGQSFEHRRGWVEDRLVDLADSFAVSLYAWAVMSNHSHVVLFIDPTAVSEWSDQEVADRWVRINRTLFTDVTAAAETLRKERREALLADPSRLREIRERLGSLSWFMRFLNEAIALAANREDCCSGRFWEGRFHCKALTTDDAVLASMSYVDLNPVRAGLADRLQTSEHTAIHRRLVALGEDPATADEMLKPLAGPACGSFPFITNAQYVELVDCRPHPAQGQDRPHHRTATGLASTEAVSGPCLAGHGDIRRADLRSSGRRLTSPGRLRREDRSTMGSGPRVGAALGVRVISLISLVSVPIAGHQPACPFPR